MNDSARWASKYAIMLGAWSAAKRELALAHADGRLSDEDYLARVASVRREQGAAPADRALAYLRNLAETWANPGIRPETRAQVIHAVYERIEVRGLTSRRSSLRPRRTLTAWRWRSPSG